MKKLILFLILSTQTLFAQEDLFNEGNAQLNKKNYKEAEMLFRKAVENDNKNLIFKAQLALSLIEQGKLVNSTTFKAGARVGKDSCMPVCQNQNSTIKLWYIGILLCAVTEAHRRR